MESRSRLNESMQLADKPMMGVAKDEIPVVTAGLLYENMNDEDINDCEAILGTSQLNSCNIIIKDELEIEPETFICDKIEATVPKIIVKEELDFVPSTIIKEEENETIINNKLKKQPEIIVKTESDDGDNSVNQHLVRIAPEYSLALSQKLLMKLSSDLELDKNQSFFSPKVKTNCYLNANKSLSACTFRKRDPVPENTQYCDRNVTPKTKCDNTRYLRNGTTNEKTVETVTARAEDIMECRLEMAQSVSDNCKGDDDDVEKLIQAHIMVRHDQFLLLFDNDDSTKTSRSNFKDVKINFEGFDRNAKGFDRNFKDFDCNLEGVERNFKGFSKSYRKSSKDTSSIDTFSTGSWSPKNINNLNKIKGMATGVKKIPSCNPTPINSKDTITNNSKQGLHYTHNCSICDINFENSSSLEWHLRTHVSNNSLAPILCKCDLSFSNEKDLIFHNESVHNMCNECGRTFTYKNLLKVHMANVHSRVIKCVRCYKTFPRNKLLEKHMALKHRDFYVKNFKK